MLAHHPDGYVMLGGERVDAARLAVWEPLYSLPAGAIGRVYEPGARHYLIYAGRQEPQPAQWAFGDYLISVGRRYAARQQVIEGQLAAVQGRRAVRQAGQKRIRAFYKTRKVKAVWRT